MNSVALILLCLLCLYNSTVHFVVMKHKLHRPVFEKSLLIFYRWQCFLILSSLGCIMSSITAC